MEGTFPGSQSSAHYLSSLSSSSAEYLTLPNSFLTGDYRGRGATMAALLFGRLLLFVLSTILPLSPAVLGSSPAIMRLERAIPIKGNLGLDKLRNRDRMRHGRLLGNTNEVVDFAVDGTFDPYVVGLYFTRVRLGNPSTEFYVQIDTGSDVLWVSCSGCQGCPQLSGLQVPMNSYDLTHSSTGSTISCSDQRCEIGRTSETSCSNQNNRCSYTFQYGDGSGTSGFYVSDYLHMDMIPMTSSASNATANIVFGCSNSQTGDLMKPERAVNGIFGFGQQEMSVISQLSTQGLAPHVFSHCLRGDDGGGGILVLGEIIEPNMVYSPLVPSQPHYNLKLDTISVNGKTLPIDSSLFETSSVRGTIVDSGTTLAYLGESYFDTFVNSISQIAAPNASPLVLKGNQCYAIAYSVRDVFPNVSMNFDGGASMILYPEDYLVLQNTAGGGSVWCMGFQKIGGQEMTILGDLVLKNKIIVYDIGRQRIGWVNYDCSGSVNVSTSARTGKTQFVDAKPMRAGAARGSLSRPAVFFTGLMTVIVILIL